MPADHLTFQRHCPQPDATLTELALAREAATLSIRYPGRMQNRDNAVFVTAVTDLPRYLHEVRAKWQYAARKEIELQSLSLELPDSMLHEWRSLVRVTRGKQCHGRGDVFHIERSR